MRIRNDLPLLLLLCMIFAASLSAATVDGIQLHSSIYGKGPKTIILVHGWTCDETTWESQVSDLSRDYRVITLDLPGHGKGGSPRDGNLSMDLFARAIEAVRAESKADPVVLAGHSMGTPVIIQYARMYPQHTAALVFVDGGVSPPMNSKAPAFDAEQFSGPEGLKMRENMIRGMFSSLTTQEMQKHILTMMLGAPASTAAGAIKAMMDPAIWKEDVIAKPIFGIYAGNSMMLDNTDYVKKRFPNLEFVKMPGTGHFLMMEKPQEFNQLLRSFLDRQKY